MKRIGATVAAIVAMAIIGIFIASEVRLSRRYKVALTDFKAAAFNIAPHEAERRARTLMCNGCHAEAGNVLFENAVVGRLIAPNLGRKAREYSDAELERLLRHGIKKDGTAVVSMPSDNYALLADEDIAAIVTWLRQKPLLPDSMPNSNRWGPLGRIGLAAGKIPFAADHIPQAPRMNTRPPNLGRYLVNATCLHCHQMNSDHDDGFGMKTPPLRMMVQSYSCQQFTVLMTSGKGIGGRDLGLMTSVARDDFSHFSEQERQAIYDYLNNTGG